VNLEKPRGGKGILLGGVAGANQAKVIIIGGGIAGTNAMQVALGMGAEVIVFDRSEDRLREISAVAHGKLITKLATNEAIAEAALMADLVIGAVLVPGAAAPKVLSRETICKMQAGSVLIDIAIDQGGCFETSKPTNFQNPTYVEGGVIHQCITNLPGAVPRTSTFALNNATLPFIIELANKGYKQACLDNQNLLHGLNICKGMVTHESVAKAINHTYVPALKILND